MDNKKKIIISLTSLFLLVVVASVGTYAWFKWRTTAEETVNINLTATSVITFVGGTDITGVLEPARSYREGIKKEVRITSELPGSTFNLYLKINSLPEGLKGSFFIWTVYKGNENVGSGNFANASVGDNVVILLNRSIPANTYDTYTLYLWLDASAEINPNNIGNNVVDFDLYATGDSGSVNEA